MPRFATEDKNRDEDQQDDPYSSDDDELDNDVPE